MIYQIHLRNYIVFQIETKPGTFLGHLKAKKTHDLNLCIVKGVHPLAKPSFKVQNIAIIDILTS